MDMDMNMITNLRITPSVSRRMSLLVYYHAMPRHDMLYYATNINISCFPRQITNPLRVCTCTVRSSISHTYHTYSEEGNGRRGKAPMYLRMRLMIDAVILCFAPELYTIYHSLC